MSQIVVIGAGFAGVWAAVGAVRELEGQERADVQVTVVAPGDDLVIRPRLYEDNPEQMRVALDRVLGPVGVRRIPATVTDIDTKAHRITALDRDGRTVELTYDKLVVAAGSVLVQPEIPGAEHLLNADTLHGAAQLHAHIGALPRREGHLGQYTAVVVGGGFTGLEVATELPARLKALSGGQPVRVVMVDRAQELAAPLGEGPRPLIAEALDKHGVEVRQGRSVSSVDAEGVTLDDGERIPAATVVWTVGMRAASITEKVPGERDNLGRLKVDGQLRVTGVPDVFATGDSAAAAADAEHTVMQSCQHAVPLGKHAGYNVAADLLGGDLVTFAPDQYVTCLDLGPGAAVFTTGWDRQVQLTGAEAKELKGKINTEWIYPPVDDRQAILDLADHRRTWPID